MRVNKVNYNSKLAILIYITLQEQSDVNIIEQIKDLKKIYNDVAVFVSGTNSLEKALVTIIQERRQG